MPRVYPPIEGRQAGANISPSLVESVAGFTAGIVSTLAVHPFDVVKTRLQGRFKIARPGGPGADRIVPAVETSPVRARFGDSWRVVQGIARNEGSYMALYRGLVPNMIGNSVSWALYFLWYGNIKDFIRSTRGHGDVLTSSDYFLASGASGILTACFTNPIWVIKTRMLSTGKDAPGAYRSVWHGVAEIWKNEGFKGFYRGLTPSLFGVSHGAIQFMAYEQLKNHWARSRGGKDGLTNMDFLLLSAVSKMFAGSVTYPYQVVRTRLQTYDSYRLQTTARGVVKQVWTKEGLAGFYRGLGPNILRVLPSTCVTFLVYENTKFYLPRFYAEDELMDAVGSDG